MFEIDKQLVRLVCLGSPLKPHVKITTEQRVTVKFGREYLARLFHGRYAFLFPPRPLLRQRRGF